VPITDEKIILSFSSQQKQRCPAIEELLVDLIVLAMERSEENEASMMETGCQLWRHLSSHLIFFVLFQFASFPHMVMSLYTKVQNNKSVDYRIACLNLHTRNNNFKYMYYLMSGAPNGNFRENICSEDDLRTRIFGTFVVKFLACLPLLGFSNIYKMV